MNIEQEFNELAEWVRKNDMPASNEEKVLCYGYYKQATLGDNNTAAPWMINLKERTKWNMWNENKGMCKETAQELYVKTVKILEKKYNL